MFLLIVKKIFLNAAKSGKETHTLLQTTVERMPSFMGACGHQSIYLAYASSRPIYSVLFQLLVQHNVEIHRDRTFENMCNILFVGSFPCGFLVLLLASASSCNFCDLQQPPSLLKHMPLPLYHLASTEPPSYVASLLTEIPSEKASRGSSRGLVRDGTHFRWQIPLLTCRALSVAPASWWGLRCVFTFLWELLLGEVGSSQTPALDAEKRFRTTEVFLAILWVRFHGLWQWKSQLRFWLTRRSL